MRELYGKVLRVVRALICTPLPKNNPNGLATTIFRKPTKPRMPAAWLESDAKIVVKVYHGGGVHLTPSDPYQPGVPGRRPHQASISVRLRLV